MRMDQSECKLTPVVRRPRSRCANLGHRQRSPKRNRHNIADDNRDIGGAEPLSISCFRKKPRDPRLAAFAPFGYAGKPQGELAFNRRPRALRREASRQSALSPLSEIPVPDGLRRVCTIIGCMKGSPHLRSGRAFPVAVRPIVRAVVPRAVIDRPAIVGVRPSTVVSIRSRSVVAAIVVRPARSGGTKG